MGQTTRYRHGAFDLLGKWRTRAGSGYFATTMVPQGSRSFTRSGNQQWRLYYDAAGQMAGRRTGPGRRTVYIRDEQGRLAEKNTARTAAYGAVRGMNMAGWRPSAASIRNSAIRYDRHDRMVSAQVYERSDGSEAGYTLTSEVKLEWDERHRLVAEEQDGQRTEYRYDEAGRLTGTTTPDGETQREYDASGILTGYRSNGHRMDFSHSPRA